MYVFSNKSDQELKDLRYAITEELERRFMSKVACYPRLECGYLDKIGKIEEYRFVYDINLMEAKLLVEHYHP